MTATALARSAAELPASFAGAFNTGRLEAALAMYEPDAILVVGDGRRPTGGSSLAAALDEYLRLGPPITVAVRKVFENGDLALLIVDWKIAGTPPDGRTVDLSGTATDVARRGADGHWRYAIDNPFGAA